MGELMREEPILLRFLIYYYQHIYLDGVGNAAAYEDGWILEARRPHSIFQNIHVSARNPR
jgi:hypothetical protein